MLSLNEPVLIVNLHRSTRTNEYAAMQNSFIEIVKADWFAYINMYERIRITSKPK